jgi:DNA replication and repair protein RecF
VTAVRRVALKALSLSEFRNHRSLTLSFDERHIVLTGHNGAGKTNLLEAVSLLAPGRGLRRAALDDMACKAGPGGFAIGATLQDGRDEVRIGTGFGAAANSDAPGRFVRVNGTAEMSADALNDHARLTWLTPAMDGVFSGPAADRRKMLDRMVLAVEPAHARHSIDHDKAMRARNRLIADDVRDDKWFDALEQELALHGAAIALARARMVAALNAAAARPLQSAAFPSADLALEGEIDELAIRQTAGLDIGSASARLASACREALAASRSADRQAGRALFGPHRSDLLVTHAAKAMPAALASTGEQKALLTGMVLAHAGLIGETSGMTAFVLLDEIGAHFDAARRADLFDILDALGGQAIMTGTEAHLFEALGSRAQHFAFAGGRITPQD